MDSSRAPDLDRASENDARAALSRCCGSTRWVERMLARRPFGTVEQLRAAARTEWFALSPADWREAFTHHPKIGDRDALRQRFAGTRDLSEREQSGVAAAPEEVLVELAEANAAYEARFGYIFIVCATGRSARELLGILRARLDNEPDEEIRIAAEEQAKITDLRLLGL
jgi:2-oxo-4-hydroxy-4-carboxy-5-ureidoimidazoline decarboxylase